MWFLCVASVSWGVSPRLPCSRFARVFVRNPAFLCIVQTQNRTSWGILPRPPFSRFARRAVVAELHHCCVVGLSGGFWTTHHSAPSEARKRGSGGGSPSKSDDRPPGPLDLSKHQVASSIRYDIYARSAISIRRHAKEKRHKQAIRRPPRVKEHIGRHTKGFGSLNLQPGGLGEDPASKKAYEGICFYSMLL
jgi:hypothetical protein